MMFPSRAVIGGIGLIMVMAVAWSRGEGAEWSAEPSLSVRGDYNSNLLLTSAEHRDTWGHWVSPGVTFGGATERFEVSGKAATDFVSYYGGVDQSITNMNFPLSMKYRTEGETFGLDGGFIRDNTLMGELQQTGVVLRFTQRNYWNVAPSWTHALTERLSLQGGYQFTNAAYENGLQLGLVDYTTHGGSAGLIYHTSETNQVQLTGIVTEFEAPQASSLRSSIYGGQVSMTHAFTETVTASLSAGGRYVSSSVDAGFSRLRDSQIVWVGDARLRKKWADATATIEASREVFPSGFGLLLQTSRIGIGLSKEVTERFSLSLDAAVLFATSVTSKALPAMFPENRYVSITPGLHWRMADWWTMDLSYSYARRDVESFNEMAFSNAAMIMLTYFPPKWSVGR
jgi:hypothetical protein